MDQRNRLGADFVAILASMAVLGLNSCGGSESSPTQSYTVGGVVSGLTGSSLVLQNSNGTELTVMANGNFAFPSAMVVGSTYAISIKAQPTNSSQSCVIVNASGEVTDTNISNILVSCHSDGRFVYASSHSGIYCFSVDPTTGALTPLPASPCDVGVLTGVAVDPNGKFAYATVSDSNQIRGYTINNLTGSLSAIPGSQLDAGGGSSPIGPSNPVDITVDPTGHFVYMANYAGSISAYSINSATGGLTAVSGSPFPTAPAAIAGQVPGALSVTVDPTARFLYAAINQGNDISAYAIDSSTGALTPIPGSPFPAGTVPMTVRVDPSGRFAYVTNANSNDISAYAIDSATGALTALAGSPFSTGGSSPGGLAVDPSGKFIYVTNNGSISVLAIDGGGALSSVAGSPFPVVAGQVSAAVNPSGQFLYVGSADVSGFAINSAGYLTPIVGSPFAIGNGNDIYSLGFAD
jgi:6-phosphogluconolactonase